MKTLLLSSIFFFLTLGLAAQTAETEDLLVYPNPVTTEFEIGGSERVASIRVINMVGREVGAFAYRNGSSYDISALPQGMYLVQLRDAGKNVIHTQRIKKG